MATAREALTRQVDYLSHLLDDLLDLSRLRRGTLPLRAQPVALKAVINAAIEASKLAMENKQHSFTVEEVATTLHVNGDKSMLIRIFSNLLKHVARHTESGRLLQLQIKPHNFGVDVIVKNTGFMPEKIQRALEDFMQKKFTRQPGRDLDISLSLICGLVQLNAGQISAYGNATGNGSDIVVYLPGVDDNAITA